MVRTITILDEAQRRKFGRPPKFTHPNVNPFLPCRVGRKNFGVNC